MHHSTNAYLDTVIIDHLNWNPSKLTSQAGTGHVKTWVRHEKGNLVNFTGIWLYLNSLDPPVVIMLEDEMLPEKYKNKEVLWIYEIGFI